MSDDGCINGHILSIVQHCDIAEQGELQKILHDRGYSITQATLSRRLKKLKIFKVSGLYKPSDSIEQYAPGVLSLQISESALIVLKVRPGHASGIAYLLDKKYVNYRPDDDKNSGLLGTIAGDDTVLLITNSCNDVDRVLSYLYKEFPSLRKY